MTEPTSAPAPSAKIVQLVNALEDEREPFAYLRARDALLAECARVEARDRLVRVAVCAAMYRLTEVLPKSIADHMLGGERSGTNVGDALNDLRRAIQVRAVRRPDGFIDFADERTE